MIPAAFDGAYEAIIEAGLSDEETPLALETVMESLLSNIAGKIVANSATAARVAALPDGFATLLTNLTTKVATKAASSSSSLQTLTGALVRSLPAAGVGGDEIQNTYVAAIVQTTTSVVLQSTTADKKSAQCNGQRGLKEPCNQQCECQCFGDCQCDSNNDDGSSPVCGCRVCDTRRLDE